MKGMMLAAGIALALGVAPESQAQVSVDVSKITCEQLGNMDEPELVGIWLSGYYNAKRNNTVLELKQIKANAEAVVKQCMQDPKATVMQAVEKAARR